MSNRQNDESHNQPLTRGVNNQDPQAKHDQESQDWKDAQRSQDKNASGGKRRVMPGAEDSQK